ncbi:MFS transporter [Virgisporangium aurantiacum]|uniref:Multidrug efflux pump Tap n=1 Tax=Virgisporangium aurantiacum TaxID=175570 RepID=A0A8J3ZA29_9ACTN|nr:MFS transporter [Virgisporangium aurantiacum]GIJ60166.1 putative drug antiporter protein precursor [Virgisporangium aurantiacum]
MSRRAPFTALISAYVVSVAGTSMSAIAIPWLVLTTTGSAARTGVVVFAQLLPYVAAQMLAGPVVDRFGLRRSFVWGNAAAAVAIAVIPVCYALDVLTLPVLIGLVVLVGVLRGVADCANGPLVPTTAEVGGIPLERAAGLNSGANRAALLLGAPLAGVLVTLFGSPAVIAIDAGTFAVAAAVAAIWVRVPEPPPAEATGVRGYLRDLGEGLRFVRGDRLLLGIITMVAVTNLLDQGLGEVMVPVWVRDEIGTPAVLGLISGVGGGGAVLGSFLGAWLAPKLPRWSMFSVSFVLSGAPRFVVLALSDSLVLTLTVWFVAEVFSGTINPILGAVAYERIPTELRARVLGVVRSSAWLGLPFGALAGGYLTEAWGLTTALWVFGAAYLLTTLAPFVFPSWRELDRRPEPAADAREAIPAG